MRLADLNKSAKSKTSLPPPASPPAAEDLVEHQEAVERAEQPEEADAVPTPDQKEQLVALAEDIEKLRDQDHQMLVLMTVLITLGGTIRARLQPCSIPRHGSRKV